MTGMHPAGNLIAASVVPLAAIAGDRAGCMLAETLDMSGIFAQILGPLGTTVALIFAVRWLVARLERSENAQTENTKTLVEISVSAKTVIEQNSAVLADVKAALETLEKTP